MVIVKENAKSKSSLKEGFSLEDVIGLGGFKGYTIGRQHYLYVDNSNDSKMNGGTLVQGPGSISSQDVNLVYQRQAVVSFPIKNIKSIRMRGLNVLFYLNDGMEIEFIR
jgi:hypothetical protein